MNNFLDKTGLTYFWGKIKSLFTNVAYVGPDDGLGGIIDEGGLVVDITLYAEKTWVQNLGYLTSHQNISGKADKVSNATNGNFASLNSNGNLVDSGKKASDFQAALISGTNIKTINGNSILGEGNISISGSSSGGGDENVIEAITFNGAAVPVTDKIAAITATIPAEVTESTVSSWGFTKNTGTYSKPSGGIPKTDLATAVQTSLGKADTALQSYTETDPVFTSSVASEITSTDITNWNSKTSNVGTITGITMNGASKGTSGVVDLGTVITSHQDISGKANTADLATVATSGSYNDLSNKPTIPSAVTESTVSGWGFTKNAGTLTGVKFNNTTATVSNGVASITTTIPAAPGTLNTNNTAALTVSSSEALSGTINLHKVAKTGTYSDLIGTPTIPTVPTNVSAFTNDANYVSSNNTVTIYSGSSTPSSSLGSNGDIYIQTS